MVRAPSSSDPQTVSSTWRVVACLRTGPTAYMARYIANTAVRMRIRGTKSATVHIAYCIGLQQP
jgi:hypothetical protein